MVHNSRKPARPKTGPPELAARETKIKVERIRDLENDDYSHFSSPTYARGFVRTYARALGLDEYKILRQLDQKLPEDETGTFVPEGGLPYVPEPSVKAMHVSSAPRTGLYVVLGAGTRRYRRDRVCASAGLPRRGAAPLFCQYRQRR